MALEPSTLRALRRELQRRLLGGRLEDVRQAEGEEMALVFRHGDDRVALFLSVHPRLSRVWWEPKAPTLAPPSRFAITLKRRLAGARLRGVAQVDFDRLLHLRLVRREENGSEELFTLVVELLHGHGNLILIEEPTGRIIDCFRRVPRGRVRQLSPGAIYHSPPEPRGMNPVASAEEEWREAISTHLNLGISKAMIQSFRGFSPLWAAEVAHRAQVPGESLVGSLDTSGWEKLLKALKSLVDELKRGQYKPHLTLDEKGRAMAISVIDLRHLEPDRKLFFPSVNRAIISLFDRLMAQETLDRRRVALLKRAKRERQRLRTLRENLVVDLRKAERAEEFRRTGDLIMANLQRLRRGMSHAMVIDVYDPRQREIEIELEPRLGPAENADHYFKRSRKAKAGMPIIQRRLREATEGLQTLEGTIDTLHATPDWSELQKIEGKLPALASTPTGKGKPKDVTRRFRRFTTFDGWCVLVGRDDRENDELTHRVAAPDDFWFHAQGVSGSHVILRRRGRRSEPSRRSLEEAASLAAYFSQARTSKVAPVVYTLRKYVRKPRGARPGVAVMEREKILFVEPRLWRMNGHAGSGFQSTAGEVHKERRIT